MLDTHAWSKLTITKHQGVLPTQQQLQPREILLPKHPDEELFAEIIQYEQSNLK